MSRCVGVLLTCVHGFTTRTRILYLLLTGKALLLRVLACLHSTAHYHGVLIVRILIMGVLLAAGVLVYRRTDRLVCVVLHKVIYSLTFAHVAELTIVSRALF